LGPCRFMLSVQGLKMCVFISRGWCSIQGSGTRNGSRKQERRCIAESAGEKSVESDIFGLSKRVVSVESKMASVKGFLKCCTGESTFGDEAFKRARRDNGRLDTRSRIAKYRKMTLRVGGGNTQNAVAIWNIGMAFGRNHACTTWTFRCEASIQMKVGGVMCGGGLGTVVKMCTWSIKVKARVGSFRRRVG
jgi:hypothetical protein